MSLRIAQLLVICEQQCLSATLGSATSSLCIESHFIFARNWCPCVKLNQKAKRLRLVSTLGMKLKLFQF
jgi:hypothetical protein